MKWLRNLFARPAPSEVKLLQLTDIRAPERNNCFALRAIELGRWGEGGYSWGYSWGMPGSGSELFCPPTHELVIRADKDPRIVSVYLRRR